MFLIKIVSYIYNKILYFIITSKKVEEEVLEIETIKKLRNELLISDIRNSILLKRINELREEVNKKIDYIAINEELKELKISYSRLNKIFENTKIECYNANIILKHSNQRNYILQERYKVLKMEFEEKILSNSDNICNICCKNKINISCIPCGHTYCDECIKMPENDKCYICRQKFHKIQKIYI